VRCLCDPKWFGTDLRRPESRFVRPDYHAQRGASAFDKSGRTMDPRSVSKVQRPQRGPVGGISTEKIAGKTIEVVKDASSAGLMDSDAIISVENLGKMYRLRHGGQQGERYTALRDVIAEKAKRLFKKTLKSGKTEKLKSGNGQETLTSDLGPPTSGPTSDLRLPTSGLSASREDFWALKNVSFEVRRGEVLGIIGRNGAGKSTLLKILSRITEPTEGRVRIRGRVASLLEVGTGFHPELTGRENIYLNGAILGMTRAEIKKKFDEIVAFAETEKFLDTPVKRYSSGMYVRLAFAVAAHLEPEILVVDEVLAVGDAEFQKKCLGKMESVARGEGRTVLFVSHNMVAIQTLCPKAVLLDRGTMKFIGESREAAMRYSRGGAQTGFLERSANSTGAPTITRVEVRDIDCGQVTSIELDLQITSGIRKRCSIEIKITDTLGIPVGFASIGLLDPKEAIEVKQGVEHLSCSLVLPRMARGVYRLNVQLAVPMIEVIDSSKEELSFEVNPTPLRTTQRAMELNWGYGAIEIPLVIKRGLSPFAAEKSL
jgi:homopolymeric O-antigen transport system ATP-binding protein